jgi:polyisoprenyl-phosphate glycosyltransferase
MTIASAIPRDEMPPALSIVIPCYNESTNLPLLYNRLCAVLDGLDVEWEMIAVDDHSRDKTFEILAGLAERDRRVCAIRLARNVGSHVAVMCGLEHSRGSAVIMMSADLQDPPEIIVRMVEKWRNGDQVVWAVRGAYEGRSVSESVFSRVYNIMMARILDNDHITSEGADFFLVDRIVVNALTQHREANLSLFGILAWLGFRQGSVSYTKEERKRGRSGWTLKKKLKLFVDSVTAFSYVPIRFMSAIGICVAFSGCIYASVVILNYFFGVPPEGWTSVIIIVLVIGGLQIAMLGVLGEYLWRSLDESRRRPRYNVECVAGPLARPSVSMRKSDGNESL